jgi:hypothetical protein
MRLALFAGVATAYFTLFYERKEVPGIVDAAAAQQSRVEHMRSGAPKAELSRQMEKELRTKEK